MTIFRFAARLLIAFALATAVGIPAGAQTASTYYTIPSIAALKALTARPPVVEVVDAHPGTFNWSTSPCSAADDIFQVTPTSGPTGCYTRAATPYSIGKSATVNGVAVTNGFGVPAISTTLPVGVVTPFSQTGAGALASNVTTKLQQTINALDYSGVDRTGTTDSITGLQNAMNEAMAKGYCLRIPAGQYKVSAALNLTANGACLYGDGAYMDGAIHTTGGTTLISTSTTADTLYVAQHLTNVYVSNLALSRNVAPVSGAGFHQDHFTASRVNDVTSMNSFVGFSLGATSYSECNGCKAFANYSHGFLAHNAASPAAYAPVQWGFVNPLSQGNNGYGFSFYAAQSDGGGFITGPRLLYSQTYANNAGGYVWSGVSGTAWSDVFAMHIVSSSDGGHGIQWENPGANIQFIGGFIELNGMLPTGRGLWFGTPTAASGVGAGILIEGPEGKSISSMSISDITIMATAQFGIAHTSNSPMKALTLTNVNVFDAQLAAPGVGIQLGNTTTKYMIANSSSKNRQFSTQTYGIQVAVGGNLYSANNDFSGNEDGSVFANDGLRANAVNTIGYDGKQSVFDLTAGGTVRANTGFSANGTAGVSKTVTVRDPAGTGTCTLVFTTGIYTGGTC